MRLRHIEVLNAVMVTGTVTAAARALHVTQPAVTHAIASMERELGYPLFERAGGRLRLTAEGRILGQESEQLMAQFSKFQDVARSMRKADGSSVLYIAAAPIFCSTFLPSVLARFAAQTDCAVSLESRLTADAIGAVESAKVELAIGFAGAERPGLLNITVSELAAICIAPRGAFGGGTVRPADLASHEVLIGEPVDPLSRALWDACVGGGLRPSRRFRIQSPQAIAALVAQGCGIGIVDACTASLVDGRQVVAHPLDVDFGLSVVVTRSSTRPLSPDGVRMLEVLKHWFGAEKGQRAIRSRRGQPIRPA